MHPKRGARTLSDSLPTIAELHFTAAEREDVGSCRSVGPTGEQEDTTETEDAPTNGPNAPRPPRAGEIELLRRTPNRKIGNGLSAASGRRAYM
jgi:hypothetical protein